LDKGARADSIPGLEIEADDVRCTHGSTVGQLDPEEIFYLMSRGLPRADAKRLVVGGFFAPLMERIPLESLRERLIAAIEERV
jgi:Fe-S cluster assembly protein SufD